MVSTIVVSDKGLLMPDVIFGRLLVALEGTGEQAQYDEVCLLAESCYETYQSTQDPNDLQECADWLKEIGK